NSLDEPAPHPTAERPGVVAVFSERLRRLLPVQPFCGRHVEAPHQRDSADVALHAGDVAIEHRGRLGEALRDLAECRVQSLSLHDLLSPSKLGSGSVLMHDSIVRTDPIRVARYSRLAGIRQGPIERRAHHGKGGLLSGPPDARDTQEMPQLLW